MLETFLDAARIGAARLPNKPEHVDLRDVVDSATARSHTLLGEHVDRREVEYDIPEGLIGAWDPVRIVRAVRALVTNALLYGDPAVPVRVEAKRLPNNRVRMIVTGGGPGPDSDELAHLFERFYRGRSAAEAGQSGSGLGLFTARGIARMHGGDVRRIEGDTFEIELPLVG
jgi:two-component system phosphate regulon sensor histidine kinase PhoR